MTLLRLLQTKRSSLPVLLVPLLTVSSYTFSSLASSSAANEALHVRRDSRIRGAFLGALMADSLSLGSHYEYDAKVIKEAYGGSMIDQYMSPGERMGGSTHGVGWGRRQYHPGQGRGDQTDYGEYTLLMLEYFSQRKQARELNRPVDLTELIPQWQDRVTSKWGAWVCTQTKLTLQQVAQGYPESRLGGNSNAMALRGAAALGVYDTEHNVAQATRKVMFTHRHPEALDAGEFFARVAFKLVHSDREEMSVRQAIEDTGRSMNAWVQEQVRKGIAKFEEATDPSSTLSKEEFVDDLAMTSMARLWEVGKTEPIKVGKASPSEGTMPSSIYIILKYQDDLELAAKANAMVGGDNASRSIAIGMVLGAAHGVEGIKDPKLRNGLNAWENANVMLSKLPLTVSNIAHEDL